MIQNTFLDVQKVESYSGQEPVSLADAKRHLRVDFTDDDTYISMLITAARQAIEDYCHISLVPKTVTLTLEARETPTSIFAQPFQVREGFNEFELPYGPVVSVDIVSTINSDGVTVTGLTLNSDYYVVGSLYKTIKISNNFDNNAIVYRVGYGAIPGALWLAILNELAYRYEERGDPSNVRATAFTEEGVAQKARILAKPYIRLTSI